MVWKLKHVMIPRRVASTTRSKMGNSISCQFIFCNFCSSNTVNDFNLLHDPIPRAARRRWHPPQ